MHGAAARDAYLAARLGVEPFTPEFTAAHLRELARGRTAPIKSFVLDQRRIAGVGNIYADEALFRARIHPLRAAGTVTPAQWARAARRDRGGAGRRDRGQGRDDRRLPPRRRRARLVPGPVPRAPPRGRAVRAVRHADPQDRRRRPRHLPVRALPAQAAGPPGGRARRATASGRSLGRDEVAEPSGAIGSEELVKAADRLGPDHDLREGDHPGPLLELGATVRIPARLISS